MTADQREPLLSIVIVAYNMAREIPRTVLSFLPPYQRQVDAGDIEIIVVENGSTHPVDPTVIAQWPANVRYHKASPASVTPATALNQGAALARGKWVCSVIDGARMASPGIVHKTLRAAKVAPEPVICTVGLHIGDQVQQRAVAQGYNQDVEDKLLEKIDWPENGYKLFEISCLGGSAGYGWFTAIHESNAITVRKDYYTAIGGYDERFDIPGGGLVNLEFFRRCVEDPKTMFVLLLGEGTFHQYHGGVTTSRPVAEKNEQDPSRTTWQVYAEQYEKICGRPWATPSVAPLLFGAMESHGKWFMVRAAERYAAEFG
ncbi:MAG: glycosyltransferase family A protein [Pseudomonadota bacterium]